MSSDNNKRIAKNTATLYIRMLFTMAVSLYTSRVILNTLGVEDYGTYNVVGGIVAMFTFLNTTLSGATSRFLTFELGKQDFVKLKKTFSSALTIHIGVALIIFILAETIGLWFVENKLVVPEGRMLAARIVYQFSILSCMISVTQVPYNASIISHEKMNIFAYISMIDVVLKLCIVYLLVVVTFDKLIFYSILVFVVSTIIAFIYRIYCTTHYKECHYKFIYDKNILKPILQFSSWDLYGNLSVVVSVQGMNVLLNLFFGPAVNAACALGNQVRSAVSGFSNNFLIAVQPQIVKEYAQDKNMEMIKLVINSSKYSFLLSFLLYLPLILENKFVLTLWLKNVPDYTVIFCQLSLVYSLVGTLISPINMAIHATGRIKLLSLISGTLFILTCPVSYVLLRIGFSPVYPFIVNIIFFIFAYISNMLILKRHIKEFSILMVTRKVIGSCFLVVLLSIPLPLYICQTFSECWTRLLLNCIICTLAISSLTYFIALDMEMRRVVISKIKRHFF